MQKMPGIQMRNHLKNKNILLGMTGSIAAYKSADLVRRLRERGANVRVAMTENAQRFITPLTMQAVSGNPVHTDLFDLQAEAAMGHIELARWADVILIAPASADFMARLQQGSANDLLTTVTLATSAPIMLAPAMNQAMWKHKSTQMNLQSLIKKDVVILETNEGNQACGDVGPGRMLEPLEIVAKVNQIFSSDLLAGINILMTAGPTLEPIDPVRCIMNFSSGKMGYALAEAAITAGANVTLVSGPVSLSPPAHVNLISVTTACEMYQAVMSHVKECDIFLGVAAVADYRCKTIATQKIAKTENSLQLTLERNPDIIKAVGELPQKPFVVGFAAETENLIAKATAKKTDKRMDMIVANLVGKNVGIGVENNAVTIIDAKQTISLPLTSKHKLAKEIMTTIAKTFKERTSL